MLYDPIKKLSRIHLVMQQCFNATNNIFEIMNREPAIKDRPGAQEITGSKGDIRIESVTFRYRPGLHAAVRDLSLHIEPGKYYALVGSSGAGKSTILSLLLRFYEPEAGVIRLDGRDINTIKQISLREQIGMVSQDTFLFHDSILNNIRYGRLNADKEEVIDAAKRAYAHDFIMHQPNGYETVIGDKGCLLSGGQQQRVSIARALLKNAPVLLLDEAMSALDSEAEREIQAALDRLSEGRTVIAIAHRLSTVLKADQIVVMDRGEVREIGTHRELLESSTIYRKLYDLQFDVQAAELAGSRSLGECGGPKRQNVTVEPIIAPACAKSPPGLLTSGVLENVPVPFAGLDLVPSRSRPGQRQKHRCLAALPGSESLASAWQRIPPEGGSCRFVQASAFRPVVISASDSPSRHGSFALDSATFACAETQK